MSLINSTVYGSVSMTTIKATPIWQEVADENGNIPRELFSKTFKLALYFLGWDTEKAGYSREEGIYIRSQERDVVFKTSVYRFPVRQDYEFKRVYEKLDVLHVGDELFNGWGDIHTKLADFGNEHQPPTGTNFAEDSEE